MQDAKYRMQNAKFITRKFGSIKKLLYLCTRKRNKIIHYEHSPHYLTKGYRGFYPSNREGEASSAMRECDKSIERGYSAG